MVRLRRLSPARVSRLLSASFQHHGHEPDPGGDLLDQPLRLCVSRFELAQQFAQFVEVKVFKHGGSPTRPAPAFRRPGREDTPLSPALAAAVERGSRPRFTGHDRTHVVLHLTKWAGWYSRAVVFRHDDSLWRGLNKHRAVGRGSCRGADALPLRTRGWPEQAGEPALGFRVVGIKGTVVFQERAASLH